MRNKDQELKWRKIIEICMEDVKNHFPDIERSIEFGAYIQPENYFVSYIFHTNAQLESARQSGLTKYIKLFWVGAPEGEPHLYWNRIEKEIV